MGCVEMVSSCLERAEHSPRACLEGITKAEVALMETKEDSDIQSVVLVKRAELLFIAVSVCSKCCGLYDFWFYNLDQSGCIKRPNHWGGWPDLEITFYCCMLKDMASFELHKL